MARLTPEQKEALVADLKAGNGTGAEIAERHGVSIATVATTKRKLGLTRNSAGGGAASSTGGPLTVDEQIAAGRKLQNILNANGLNVQFKPSFDDNFKVRFEWIGLEGFEINEGAAPAKIVKEGTEVPIYIERGQEAQVTLKLSDFAKLLK
ncbi:hypothetical protein [Sulfuriroseicoccus oceanibius]|uniref:Uncharacterized protein n=1 Tax=Sulfuriroseicoccus oceanibius TaxID=2707525 RepID=A0A6B3L8Y9_9BACT|nr:hypothetical protein [Sulfuriroseicoccus oceanibius]QQL44368.1 hypothetical protein G3M56_010795 [Sulfuriroseicoccus oceanibius]